MKYTKKGMVAGMKNRTLIQLFEWYLPSEGSLWRETAERAPSLAELGITEVWLPPAYKGTSGKNDVGYGVYDMYDLGEFDQKGSVETKYGTKSEYIVAIKALQSSGLRVYADVVFNHRLGADETERVSAGEYRFDDRSILVDQREIEAWTRFTFKNRGGKYSNFVWNHTHFDGCDWDERAKKKGLYLFDGKSWDEHVDIEMGNYDFLMGADLDFSNGETLSELVSWGKWYLDVTGVDGFRLDAVKHMNFSGIASWLRSMRNYAGKELYAVGEYWNHNLGALAYYIDKTANSIDVFDVPLHYNLHKASNSNGEYDMSKIMSETVVDTRSARAVTFVDNHDTQPGQALQSWVNGWFKPHAYSLILLRQQGLPCVFYGDLYGIPHSKISPVGKKLVTLLKARRDLAYGEQIDYFGDSSVVGFTRLGEERYPFSGLAVVMTDRVGGSLRVCMGERFIGKTLVDCLGNVREKFVVESDGCVTLPVKNGSVSVYVDSRYRAK